jgi:predicted RecA/RadA family phage recombinase
MALAVFVQQGEQIDYTPSADCSAGDVVVQGDLVGIARSAIPAGTPGSLAVAGVFDLAKASATEFAAGAKVYWDATNKLAVATDGGGANKLVGKAVRAAGNGLTTVRVRLSQ